MSHDDMSNSSGFNEAAASFSWNGPKKAINPYLDPAEFAPESALSNLITLYAADNEQEQLRREALSEQVWERYFFNESRDPVQREMEQDKLISRAKLAHEQQRFNPDMVILADVNAQPSHISKPLMQRIEYFSSLGRPKAYSRYLRETIKPCLERLEHVRDSQLSTSFRFMASHEGLDGLLILPEMSQDQVKRLSTLVAAHMSMCLDAACGDLYATDDVKPEEIRKTWEKVAAETLRLDVIPPAFEQLRRKRNRRKPVPYELIPGSLARMLCADWWYRKLWKMRCEWREEQLRAVCLVSKKASPYVSYEAVMHKREQCRKSLEFFRSHELVNEDGDALDMEDVVNASCSNPAHRRNEMMACVKGLELIAEMRGDCAVFYTITCPSRFHSTLNNGRPNPTWKNATVRQSSDYLVGMFAAFRKAMHKAGLRWYGVRVAEPHHDGTVHWHLLCFMRKKDRRAITALLRKFAIREDREELGNNTGPRFKSELINPRKGTPTSYIAKYISKNIDGRGLAGEISKETGKSLRDNAEYVNAWASLHRVQQFRFFGIPGRQAYRELRLLAGQAARQQGDKKAGVPVLDNPRLDAILAAADAGCFATYIMKQGGVLVPRKYHLIRTAYEINEEPTAYGDHGIRIYGIWSPIAEGKICTHAVKWKMVRKAVDVQEAVADQSACAPWTRGNNCPRVQETDNNGTEQPEERPAPWPQLPDGVDVNEWMRSLKRHERRALMRSLRDKQAKNSSDEMQSWTQSRKQQRPLPDNHELLAKEWRESAESLGLHIGEQQMQHLLRGGSLYVDGSIIAPQGFEIVRKPDTRPDSRITQLWQRLSRNHGVSSTEIRHNPVASYLEQLGASDPEAAARLASTLQQDQNTMKTPVTVLSDMLRAIRDAEHAQRISETTERAHRKADLLRGGLTSGNKNRQKRDSQIP